MEKNVLKIHLAQSSAKFFWQSCQDDGLQKLCTACPKYGKCWSCPPLKSFWRDFPQKHLYLVGAQLLYPKELLVKSFDKDEMAGFFAAHLTPLKNKITLALIELESLFLHGVTFSSGGCELCQKCTRLDEKPCCKIEKMRYSIDALGVDMGKCAANFLGVPLCWGEKNHLPRYHFLIHALLSDEEKPLAQFAAFLEAALKRQGIDAPLKF